MTKYWFILLALVFIAVHGFVPVVYNRGRWNPARLNGRRGKVASEQSTSLSVVPEPCISNLSSSAQTATIDPPIRNTIVFDIDDTLCTDYKALNSTMMKESVVCNLTHYFYPNWKILFDYLLANNCFIDIYSSGVDYRNEPLMKDFLTDLYGEVDYAKLLSEGQFKVYSRHHKKGCDFKRLAPIIRPNQTIDNVILVDDLPYNAAEKEPEMILVQYNFGHNIVSGLLGMFMTYFENKPQNETLRGFVGRVMPVYYKTNLMNNETQELYINKGLAEIRKIDPEVPYFDKSNTNRAPPYNYWRL